VEVDPTYYFLKTLSWLGIVWRLKMPPEGVLHNEHRLGSRVINRAAEQLASHFNAEWIARAITSTLHGHELAAIREAIASAHDRSAEALRTIHLPQLPSREDLFARARGIFAKTKSLDEIIDRANELLLAAVGAHLAATVEDWA
jgi:stearoyl-CoA desaturase (delta-9 desaturase)